MKNKRGFTLIEVLVVVLIIGILSAVAVPQYQKAVLKSRFSSLMPTTKAIANGNEAYYLTHSRYADEVAALDITTTPKAETHLTLSDDSNYAYVLATREDIKNNLIMYQRHSANYPGEVHCEALTDNTQANWLCETALKGTNIGTILNSDYTTYILQGSGNGLPPAVDDGNSMSCDKAISKGFTCTVNEEGTQRKICTMVGSTNICRTKTLNEDGGYTSVTCKANEDNVCTSGWISSTYDANGNRISDRICSATATDGTCSQYDWWGNYNKTYDSDGNLKSERTCGTVAADGSCSTYETDMGRNIDYTYDTNGNLIRERSCQTVAEDGSCNAYTYWGNVDYTYNPDGTMTKRICETIESNGTCSAYSSGTIYTYDTNGNMIREQGCSISDAEGTCTPNNYVSMYTYDANGNRTSERYCVLESDGNTCKEYYGSSAIDYVYDTNGNMISQKSQCQDIASDGTCKGTYLGNWSYSYDADGNRIEETSCDQYGTCSTSYNLYDDEGKWMASGEDPWE